MTVFVSVNGVLYGLLKGGPARACVHHLARLAVLERVRVLPVGVWDSTASSLPECFSLSPPLRARIPEGFCLPAARLALTRHEL